MENCALKVENVSKKYKDFLLDFVSFNIPKGSIVGIIGENGAGKTTILNCILNIVPKDMGDVYFFNNEKNKFDVSIREKIGVVFDETSFPEYLNLKELSNILKKIYINWEENKYFELLNKFSLDSSKKIKALSKGMKMKLALSVALSHKAKLLILDEATSGLDPVARDDILDLLLEFVQDEENSVLISSHITSDLEKIADYIVFVHEGNTVFEEKKDNLIYEYGLIKCKFNDFEKIEKADILRYRKTDCMYEILVKDKKEMEKKYSSFLMDNVKLEDIMLMYIKGEK